MKSSVGNEHWTKSLVSATKLVGDGIKYILIRVIFGAETTSPSHTRVEDMDGVTIDRRQVLLE